MLHGVHAAMYHREGARSPSSSRPPRQNQRDGVDGSYLYNVLGILKSADQNQIRKAYKKKAMMFHPDKGGDLTRFHEICAAYEILSDPEKRSKYDDDWEKEIVTFQEIRTYDSASPGQFFRTMDVKQKILCSLEDLFSGKEVTIRIKRRIVCPVCQGEGGEDGYLTTCPGCEGTGFQTFLTTSGFSTIPCDLCNGRGCYIDPRKQCKRCRGECMLNEMKETPFNVLPGMRTGSVIRLPGAGDEAPGLAAGDILLVVQERPHDLFVRRGCDLHISFKVQLGEVLCGFSRSFKHLDGRQVVIHCHSCEIQKDCMKVIRGEGMPTGKGKERGSLVVVFQVIFPSSLEVESIRMIRQALAVPEPALPANANVLTLEEGGMNYLETGAQRRTTSMTPNQTTPPLKMARSDYSEQNCNTH